MIGRKPPEADEVGDAGPRGFDDFDLRLGDLMRGERATLGKSLLDVQRELRIKASYIAAIENCDPDAFDTPGFIAGYVRSYARYLGMDPDKAFMAFCAESGFSVAHGMSDKASVIKKPGREAREPGAPAGDIFMKPSTPFVPQGEAMFSRIEPGAVGSIAVLLALIGGIGYGGWSVLQEVQRVQVTPVEQSPVAAADIDPLQGAGAQTPAVLDPTSNAPSLVSEAPRAEGLDRLYRPQALDVPVLVARDAPIATLDPRTNGALAQATPGLAAAPGLQRPEQAETPDLVVPAVPQVVEAPSPELRMVAVRPAWVRVRAADGTVIYEAIMEPGDTWTVPQTEEPPTLRVGESGAIYFAMDGQHYGPAGPRGSVTSNLPLARAELTARYEPADPAADDGLERYVAQLQSAAPVPDE